MKVLRDGALLAAWLLAAGPALAQEAGGAADVVEVRAREVPVAVSAYGVIHADAEAVLSAKVSARVEALPLREGQRVRRGDLVVRLDPRDIRAELAEAEAARARTTAGLAEARQDHARVTGLFAQQAVTTRERDRAEAALHQAEAADREAEAQVEQARSRLAHTEVRSPFDGRLVERLTEVGELASVGMPLARVEADTGFQLWADVPQGDLRHVSLGAEARVRVDGLPAPFAGEVARIVPAADPRSHTFTVKVTLLPEPGADPVYAGMFGRVEIAYGAETALTVPRTAIVRRAEVVGVYLAADGPGDLALRLVRAGRAVGEDQVIEAGLEAGERVYADGAAAAARRADRGR